MLAIINQYISHTLIDHSEHGAERSQASKVHDMFEVFGSVLETLCDQAVECEKWTQLDGSRALQGESARDFGGRWGDSVICSQRRQRLACFRNATLKFQI